MRTSTKIKRILEKDTTIGVSYHSHAKEYTIAVIRPTPPISRNEFVGKSFAAAIQLAYASIFNKNKN